MERFLKITLLQRPADAGDGENVLQINERGPRVAPAQRELMLELGNVLIQQVHPIQQRVRRWSRATVQGKAAERGEEKHVQ